MFVTALTQPSTKGQLAYVAGPAGLSKHTANYVIVQIRKEKKSNEGEGEGGEGRKRKGGKCEKKTPMSSTCWEEGQQVGMDGS